MNYDEIADRLIDWASALDDIRALWLEATTLGELRRPYGKLEVHLAIDEPQYVGFVENLQAELRSRLGAQLGATQDTQRHAKDFSLEVGGHAFHLIAEQSHLLAKRPRAEVVPLVDKTGHLPHVLDYSLRGR